MSRLQNIKKFFQRWRTNPESNPETNVATSPESNPGAKAATSPETNAAASPEINLEQKEQMDLLSHYLSEHHGLSASDFSNLSLEDAEWAAYELYRTLSGKQLLLNRSFTEIVADCWKKMLTKLQSHQNESERYNHCLFTVLFELGEMMFLCKMENAEKFLVEAKIVSKANFRKYPSRIFKALHGIELTEEEKKKGHDVKDRSENSDVLLAFPGEIPDTELEQSWSDYVRVIDNYLASIYRSSGDIKAAEEAEKEAKQITNLFDPDLQKKGHKGLSEGISVISPDELGIKEGSNGKKRYRPDFRRNSALQIGRDAQILYSSGKRSEALEQFIESNKILLEIYLDGKTGEYYDLPIDPSRVDMLRKTIRYECARDMSMNYRFMVLCVSADEKDQRLFIYMDEMFKWAHIYDEYHNNIQSKGGLAEDWIISATVLFSRTDRKKLLGRIISDIDNFYTYRAKAYLLGEKTDQSIMQHRAQANTILYETVISNPQIGNDVTDLLEKQSKAIGNAHDFHGSVSITGLVGALLNWMWDHSYNWTGKRRSLESIFFQSIYSQCIFLNQNHMKDDLKQAVDTIMGMVRNVKDPHNKIFAMVSILLYAMILYAEGDYTHMIPYADTIFELIQSLDERTEKALADSCEKILAMYKKAGKPEKAREVKKCLEKLAKNVRS